MENEILALKNISKSFSGNSVLRDVSISIKRGEIVSLLGENGAGKSTLMNILFGMEKIRMTGGYEGTIRYKGKQVTIDSPRTALNMGIGMVHQEFMLMEDYSIAENIKLNRENTKKGLLSKPLRGGLDVLDKRAMGADTRKALDSVKLSVDEWTPVAGLSIGAMQFIEIAKSLDNTVTELIIFDEPTAALTESESNALLEIIESFPDKGISCLFISHKLEEALRVSDKIVVLRDGSVVGEFVRGSTNVEKLARLMVGRELENKKFAVRDFSKTPAILSVRDLKVNMPGESVKGVSFDVKDGEIFGICGLAGSGKLGIANGIRGLYDSTGEVIYQGEPLNIHKTKEVLSKRLAFLSEDRKKVGLMLDETIEMNCVLSSNVINKRFIKRIFGIKTLDLKATKAVTEEMIKALDIRCTNKNQLVRSLSGGNQQKICIASVLLQEPRMIFASEPSRGVDIGAKQMILDYLRKLNRENHITIVLTSSELHELRSLCDRIAVIADGKLAGILDANVPIEEFGLLMLNAKSSPSEEKM
jgi:simple sugar transport system ATP-binding protein